MKPIRQTGPLGSVVMLVTAAVAAVVLSSPSASAATAGPARIEKPFVAGEQQAGEPLNEGGSATPFALLPETGAACSGDSATGGYRTQSYIVPAAVDPDTLTFNSSGPVPAGVGVDLRQPMFAATGSSSWVNKTTAVDTGLVVGLVPFSFEVYGDAGTTVVPVGVYNIGIACTKDAGITLDKFWNVQIEVTHDAADVPGGFTWTVVQAQQETTTTSTTTTTTVPASASTTTTTEPTTGTTTTTTTTTTVAAGATTTTLLGGSTSTSTTTTVLVGGTTSSTVAAGGNPLLPGSPGNPVPTPSPQLAATGSSSWKLAAWAVALLVLGRMVILIGRSPKVIPPDER